MKDKLKVMNRKSYQLLSTSTGYRIVRVLKNYDNEKAANNDLVKLLQGKITDEDLLNSNE